MSVHHDDSGGPFYDLAGAARYRRHRSQQSILNAAAQGDILMVKTVEGELLFPVWQFQNHHVHPRMLEVFKIWQDFNIDTWMVVQWFCAPHDEQGRSGIDCLLDKERDPEDVYKDAREYAWRWSQ